jgi:hypothetical protein
VICDRAPFAAGVGRSDHDDALRADLALVVLEAAGRLDAAVAPGDPSFVAVGMAVADLDRDVVDAIVGERRRQLYREAECNALRLLDRDDGRIVRRRDLESQRAFAGVPRPSFTLNISRSSPWKSAFGV